MNRTITEMYIFLDELLEAWKRKPMLRFGQLIVNALGTDPFYIEDNEARKKIREFGVEDVRNNDTTKTDIP